jgi:hypothetical protein
LKKARENRVGCKWEEKTNKKVILVCEAQKFLGKEVIVEGKVAEVFLSKENNLFLNFENPHPHQCFFAVIFFKT